MSSLEYLRKKPTFVDDVDDDFKCCICNEILIDARCGPCGCQYCLECIETHLENNDKCPGKSELCSAVNLDLYKDIGINHVANRRIEKLQIECLHAGCEYECMIKDMEEHARTCDLRIVDCPFLEIGCVRKDVTKGEIRSHIDEAGFEHTSMMVGWMGDIKNALEDIKKDYTQLKETFNNELAKQRLELEQIFSVEFAALRSDLEQLKDGANVGQLVWRIEKAVEMRTAAQNGGQESLLSPVVYSGLNGHRLRLRAWPDGTGSGKGTHLSVEFLLESGVHDDVVTWPFTRSVTVALVNAETGAAHASQTWHCNKPDASGTVAVPGNVVSRPAAGGAANPAHGTAAFVEWTVLEAGVDSLLKNGTIILKCDIK